MLGGVCYDPLSLTLADVVLTLWPQLDCNDGRIATFVAEPRAGDLRDL